MGGLLSAVFTERPVTRSKVVLLKHHLHKLEQQLALFDWENLGQTGDLFSLSGLKGSSGGHTAVTLAQPGREQTGEELFLYKVRVRLSQGSYSH